VDRPVRGRRRASRVLSAALEASIEGLYITVAHTSGTDLILQTKLYDLAMEFGRQGKVKIVKRRDAEARDKGSTYKQIPPDDGGVNGCVNLAIWKGIFAKVCSRCCCHCRKLISLKAKPPTASKDLMQSGPRLNASLDLLKDLARLSARIEHLCFLVDGEWYVKMKHFDERLRRRNNAYDTLKSNEPSIFHGRSVIFNRATDVHKDMNDPYANLTPLVTLGTYTEGHLVCPEIGVSLAYRPGTVTLVRGGMIAHGVRYTGGQRVCVAHFQHRTMLQAYDEPAPEINKYIPISERSDLKSAVWNP